MLEAIISSRIRRTLLDYLLTHTNDRFYLRGLSKELGLSVSPLRRELKRLEHSGLLRAEPEGNILFYAVDTASAAYRELSALNSRQPAALAVEAAVVQPQTTVSSIPAPSARRTPVFSIGAFSFALAGLLLAAAGASISIQLLKRPSERVTVVLPPAAASGVMRSSRWQVLPGSLGGGFGTSSAERQESY